LILKNLLGWISTSLEVGVQFLSLKVHPRLVLLASLYLQDGRAEDVKAACLGRADGLQESNLKNFFQLKEQVKSEIFALIDSREKIF